MCFEYQSHIPLKKMGQIFHICLRRGVGSGVQLVFTETRFQKCSQIGKKWFETPNVIYIYGLQCDFKQKNKPKHSNQNRRYCQTSEITKNHQKKWITQSRFTLFCMGNTHWVWHMLDATW